jgi:hypothetical protein
LDSFSSQNLATIPFSVHYFSNKKKPAIVRQQKITFSTKSFFPPIIFFCRLIDLSGFPEQMDVLFTIFKSKSRQLTIIEIAEAEKVFGKSLKYKRIRIDEKSWFAQKGADMAGYPKIGMGLVLFRSINFNRSINCVKDSTDMAWLIHELTHVRQMQSIGTAYIFESLIAQHYLGYGLPNLETDQNLKLNELNIEQQAEISKLYYNNLTTISSNSNQLITLIEGVKQGSFN